MQWFVFSTLEINFSSYSFCWVTAQYYDYWFLFQFGFWIYQFGLGKVKLGWYWITSLLYNESPIYYLYSITKNGIQLLFVFIFICFKIQSAFLFSWKIFEETLENEVITFQRNLFSNSWGCKEERDRNRHKCFLLNSSQLRVGRLSICKMYYLPCTKRYKCVIKFIETLLLWKRELGPLLFWYKFYF